ncbi:hypothetical protein ABVT39_022213 [Epinephelus coioides]
MDWNQRVDQGSCFPHRTTVSFYSAVVSTQSGHRSLKKTMACPHSDKHNVDFIALYHYDNDDDDCYVRGSLCERADDNNQRI